MAIRLAAEAAASLRRQIHRQMYRLGQSALPGEGIGPVINLFTREVNDIREACSRDLESGVAPGSSRSACCCSPCCCRCR